MTSDDSSVINALVKGSKSLALSDKEAISIITLYLNGKISFGAITKVLELSECQATRLILTTLQDLVKRGKLSIVTMGERVKIGMRKDKQ